MAMNKANINLVLIGDVGSGKSTTAGHIIYKCGLVDQNTLDQLEISANNMGKVSSKHKKKDKRERVRRINRTEIIDEREKEREITMKFETPGYYVTVKCGLIDQNTLDQLEIYANKMGKVSSKHKKKDKREWVPGINRTEIIAERERVAGINRTEIINEREREITMEFETHGYYVTVIDAPDQRHFLRNIITGTSQAECALLVISAIEGEFEKGISEIGHTLNYALFAYTVGVKQMIVGVNKMDKTEPPFSEERFDKIKGKVSVYLKTIGYQPDSVAFVPISGQDGDNIVDVSKNMVWYKGWEVKRKDSVVTGKTLIDALDSIQTPSRPTEKPLRLPLQNVYNVDGIGTVAVGRVETGIIKPGMGLTLAPWGLTTKVESVQMHNGSSAEAGPGDNVVLNIKDVSVKQIHRGNVCSDTENDPARQATEFTALVIVLNSKYCNIRKGFKAVLECHTTRIVCEFSEFLKKFDRQSGVVMREKPESLYSGNVALVRIIPSKPMCVETFAEYPPLGLFTVRKSKRVVAVGVIKSVTKKAVKKMTSTEVILEETFMDFIEEETFMDFIEEETSGENLEHFSGDAVFVETCATKAVAGKSINDL